MLLVTDTNRKTNIFFILQHTGRWKKSLFLNDNMFGSVHCGFTKLMQFGIMGVTTECWACSSLFTLYSLCLLYPPTFSVCVHVVLHSENTIFISLPLFTSYNIFMGQKPILSNLPLLPIVTLYGLQPTRDPAPPFLLCDALLITCFCFVLTWILDIQSVNV